MLSDVNREYSDLQIMGFSWKQKLKKQILLFEVFVWICYSMLWYHDVAEWWTVWWQSPDLCSQGMTIVYLITYLGTYKIWKFSLPFINLQSAEAFEILCYGKSFKTLALECMCNLFVCESCGEMYRRMVMVSKTCTSMSFIRWSATGVFMTFPPTEPLLPVKFMHTFIMEWGL